MVTASFHHPGVVVPDLERAIEFYCDVLGFEVYSRSSWDADNAEFNQIVGLDRSAARFCMLRGGNSYIEFFEYEDSDSALTAQLQPASERGLRHLAFVVSDVAAMLDLCVEKGGGRINDPVSIPGAATAAYCRDPFGNLLEFVEPGGRFPPLLTATDDERESDE